MTVHRSQPCDNSRRFFVSALLLFGLLVAVPSTAAAATEPEPYPPKPLEIASVQAAPIPPDVIAQVAAEPTTLVVGYDPALGAAAIREAAGPGADPAELQAGAVQASTIFTEQKHSALASVSSGIEVVEEFDSLPVQMVKVEDSSALTELASATGVISVALPRTYQATADADLELIHQPEAAAAGFAGAGVQIAVVDTGTDWLRAGVGNAFGNCAAGPGTGTCRISRYTDVTATGLRDTDPGGHGTNVSGTVAKTAPGASLDVYGVFDATGTGAQDADILAALNAITRDGPARGVRAVNLSLGDGAHNTVECTTSAYSGAFMNLRALGILPVVAAGNSAISSGVPQPGVSSPACASGAIRVGAVYPANNARARTWGGSANVCSDSNPPADGIACFSQYGPLVSLLAPGVDIAAAGITESGTSQAAPHVAGAVADVVSASPQSTAQQVARALVGTGRAITDPRDGTTLNRLDIAAAAVAVRAAGAAIADPNCSTNALPRNDDSSTSAISLPFEADFYGTTYRTLFVNNNGNVTFLAPQSTYTPFTIGAITPPIIAPFSADVDTRGLASGVVTYGVTTFGSRVAFCVNWDNVGYFNSHTNKLNSFQLLLVDRSDVGSGDFDIVMNYRSLNWETGDASGGSDGLNGTPAGGGFSAGDGIASHFFQYPGGLTHLGLLDSNNRTGLVNNSRGSLQDGRYIFNVRNGLLPGSGAITGLVQDAGGRPQALAPVQACPAAGGSCIVSVTGNDGTYSILGVSPGAWNLMVQPPAGSQLRPGHGGPVTLTTGATVIVNITLAGPIAIPSGTTITDHGQIGGVPVLYWNEIPTLDTQGCAGGTAEYSINQGATRLHGGAMTETPAGSGQYRATVPSLYPDHGDAAVAITISCPGDASSDIDFNIYIDPPGTVVDAAGRPITGASVTLLRADTSAGPFVPVPNGAAIMSPSNRGNPMVTAADGVFHWDVLAGFYVVEAKKAGCTRPNSTELAARSDIYEVPPPALDIKLTLDCGRAPTAAGAFQPLAPSRILDTRTNTGASNPVPALGNISVQVTGMGGIPPSGVSAVALNVTAVSPGGAGYITAWAAGTNRPAASNLNFSAGQNIPNLVIVPVGANGEIQLFNGSTGTVQLLADVAGYYLAGAPTLPGTFRSLAPSRILDTRTNTGAPGSIAALGSISVQVTGRGGVPGTGVAAVAINITAVTPSTSGYITAWPSGTARPNASNLNFNAGRDIPNLVIVPVGADGKIQLFNGSNGTVQLLADVAGYYRAGTPAAIGAFASLTPNRILDTRSDTGARGPVAALGNISIQVTGTGGVPATGVSAVAVNVTAVTPSTSGYITAWPSGTARPNASNLNFNAGRDIPNLVIVPVGADGKVEIFNGSPGTVQLLADVAGYYLAG